ncbi:MAG: pyridoxal-phosphate dependent enzyme [Verrucomicrobiales bacterium]|nr:pyridoxal-phosphate dependent enzyme [Verrucomicrobiales bacterium]
MSVWRWTEHFDAVVSPAHRVSLGEGGTPCVRSRSIGPSLGMEKVYFKVESSNPTGSYKDRFAAVAVGRMLETGCDTCVATSSGNTGAALAAYCAIAGLRCRLAVVETAPAGKLRQMLAYGAEVTRVRGFGLDPAVTQAVFSRLVEMGRMPRQVLQISAYTHSPEGMQGVESVGMELTEVGPWDAVFCPAGAGGLTLAVARGLERMGATRTAVHCVQPEGNATIVTPLRDGERRAQTVTCTTRISGLQVPTVMDGDAVIQACRKSGGNGFAVSDIQVMEMQRRLAREEGIFAEPAGAVALAGLQQALARGEIDPAARVVCLVTGSGFKDLDSIEVMTADAPCPLVELAEWEG